MQLIARASAFICNECVQDAVEIISIKHPRWLQEHSAFVANLVLQLRDDS